MAARVPSLLKERTGSTHYTHTHSAVQWLLLLSSLEKAFAFLALAVVVVVSRPPLAKGQAGLAALRRPLSTHYTRWSGGGWVRERRPFARQSGRESPWDCAWDDWPEVSNCVGGGERTLEGQKNRDVDARCCVKMRMHTLFCNRFLSCLRTLIRTVLYSGLGGIFYICPLSVFDCGLPFLRFASSLPLLLPTTSSLRRFVRSLMDGGERGESPRERVSLYCSDDDDDDAHPHMYCCCCF